jgi:hypothetical protein
MPAPSGAVFLAQGGTLGPGKDYGLHARTIHVAAPDHIVGGFSGGRRHTVDARHNRPRIGRILMARGRDATDAAISTAFGANKLVTFKVVTEEMPQG